MECLSNIKYYSDPFIQIQVKSKSIQKLLASNAEWKLQSKKLLKLLNKMY